MKKFIVQVKNKEYEVFIREVKSKQLDGLDDIEKEQQEIEQKVVDVNKEIDSHGTSKNVDIAGGSYVTAPMSGKVLAIKVKEGELVERGQVIITIEAMKMETEIVAPVNGSIGAILVKTGSSCTRNDKLAFIKEVGGA